MVEIEIGKRLRALRESIKLPQAKMATLIGTQQSSIHRFETAQTAPSAEVLLKYADYFEVSMDYIYGRTDNPQGALYSNKPVIEGDNSELREFIEMCFDPESPMNDRLKDMLFSMMVQEGKKK